MNAAQQQQIKTLLGSPQQMQPQQQIIMQGIQGMQGMPQQFIQLKQDGMQGMPQQFMGGGQLVQTPNGMFSLIQPMQTVTVDGQEALFIPNMQNAQMAGAQAVNIGGQQAFITPNGQIIRAPTSMMPGNFLQNMQAVQLPNGEPLVLFDLLLVLYQ